MTSDEGNFELTGSLTGPDGSGNAFQSFTSRSGQIIIDPKLWRRAERNRTGDRFTFDVTRSIISEIDFQGHQGDVLVIRLAHALQNTQHTLKLVPVDHAVAAIDAFQVFQPPVTER